MTDQEQMLYKNFKQAQVRQQILDAVREDLIGPRADGKPLTEDPSKTYIAGILFPSNVEFTVEEENFDNEAEDSPQSIEIMVDNSDNQETVYEETDDVQRKKFKKPHSMGVSFYVSNNTSGVKATVKWGTYTSDEYEEETTVINQETGEEEKKVYKRSTYTRVPKEEAITITFSDKRNQRIPFPSNPNLYFYVITRIIKKEYRMVTIYVQNCDAGGKGVPEWQNAMYQTELVVSGINDEDCFIAEYICREQELEDEFYYKSRPVFARGRQCAADWENPNSLTNARIVKSAFIPNHEIAGVKADIEGFEENAFSTWNFSRASEKENTIFQLSNLINKYENWISELPDTGCSSEKYKQIKNNCIEALNRMRNGIHLIETNEKVFKAFLFMNESMYLQKAISLYSKSNDPDKSIPKITMNSDGSHIHLLRWRPFQIAFILLNIVGIAVKDSTEDCDRNIVDLLYFPTGGGKTEAYLGLIAFTIGLRRLSSKANDEFDKDGGVTVFLRYTLRLLTTQQRDRLLKLIISMEMIRKRAEKKENSIYGKTPISIGFWVGGQVTPNDFDDYTDESEYKRTNFIKMVSKQLVKCPCCGCNLTQDNYFIDPDNETIKIYCSNERCRFIKTKDTDNPIPVYLVDTEIYHKCPTVIISTVDKFARLPWDERVGSIFGHINRYCPKHGYLAVGEEHPGYHKKNNNSKIEIEPHAPFYPPELIIQDELHLITGPLGTIYGGYETAIEYLCTVKGVKPKYVVSTATIKNAEEQIKTLYGREEMAQFPPSGTDIKDSFFMKEIDLPEMNPIDCTDEQIKQMITMEQKPFREYVGICVPGQSVKTTLIRLYAVILQKVFDLAKNLEFEDYVDPYYTLIGYFNSIRELGGAVRLLEDDIVKRIDHIVDKYGYQYHRYLSGYDSKKEITSRIKSHEITEILEHLAIPFDKTAQYQNCYDVVIATNMIAVGMDVDRLGLMAVLGQPKQNAEYIQATSRVGRQSPGLIFSLYNPYRPRDLSNYENFMGFHTQMYRYVEGTTSTPFAARAIDRDMHALILSLIRLTNEKASRKAVGILDIDDSEIEILKQAILDRVKIVDYMALDEAELALDSFINTWKALANDNNKTLVYNVKYPKQNQQRLISRYGLEINGYNEKPTLNSMRDVEHSANIFLWEAK